MACKFMAKPNARPPLQYTTQCNYSRHRNTYRADCDTFCIQPPTKIYYWQGDGGNVKRAIYRDSAFRGLCLTALLALAVGVYAAETRTEITLPGTRVFPESITSTSDGTLIVGSLGHGNVMRIAPGKTTAEGWIKPGTSGLNSVLGVYADEKNKLLWVCSNKLGPMGEATSVKTFDLKSGAPKNSYVLPGEGTLCNDIAVGADRTAYVTDTRQGSVVMLKPRATALEIAAKDPLLAGADGLAFGDKTTLT